uniref:Uncharacterized protein n=1 Tax=Salix viminalis TaxID=40686 RepID=A0A6N2NLB4_SALVM
MNLMNFVKQIIWGLCSISLQLHPHNGKKNCGYKCSSRDKKRKTNSPDKKTPGKSCSTTNDPTRKGLHEAKQQALEPDESTGADTAKEGVRKAKQVADTIGDAAMETVDGAREAAKEANQKIRNKI